MSQTFILHADEGRANVLRNLLEFIKRLPWDKPWKIEITLYKPTRSSEQNRYLWGVVYQAFAAALPGWDKDDIHDYLLGECFGWERLEGMGRVRLKPIKRSSRLDKGQFADYVDFCQRKGAEHGIYVPDPDPLRAAA